MLSKAENYVVHWFSAENDFMEGNRNIGKGVLRRTITMKKSFNTLLICSDIVLYIDWNWKYCHKREKRWYIRKKVLRTSNSSEEVSLKSCELVAVSQITEQCVIHRGKD